MANLTIVNGRVLRRDRFVQEPLYIENGIISDTGDKDAPVLDANGAWVLPGIVDIHGDGFEAHIMPRPGVHFDMALALQACDRQLISHGITTAYHSLTVSWEPGLRSLAAAKNFVAQLAALRPELAVDTLLHIRWETFAADAIDAVAHWLQQETRPILAFNDHTTAMVEKGLPADKIGKWAARCSLSETAYRDLILEKWDDRSAVPANIAQLAAVARRCGATLLAHDENSAEMRNTFRGLGAIVSEFPVNHDTMQAASRAGEHVVLGAPNVVRGGSHTGNLDATEAVLRGHCTILASDYYYPAPLHAVFKLCAKHRLPLEKAWDLVSANPAAAAGLRDRGILETGNRGDVVIVKGDDLHHPLPLATVVAGAVAGQWRP